MNKLVVFQVDANMGNTIISIGAEEDEITLAQVVKVNDQEAFSTVRDLARNEGIIAGSSSGAAMAAALKLAKTLDSGNIVVVFPDRGDRYFSTGLFG